MRVELDELIAILDSPSENPFCEERCAQLARFLSGEDAGEELLGAFARKGLKEQK